MNHSAQWFLLLTLAPSKYAPHRQDREGKSGGTFKKIKFRKKEQDFPKLRLK
jgi:hypothetical protein